MNIIERIIYCLQYEIDRPKVYGLFHIISLLITLILIIFLLKKKEKNHEKTLKIILGIYGFGSLILEVLKQIVWSFNYDPVTKIITWDYNWYAAPFQLCTTPIFIAIICLFLKKNKLRNNLLSYMAFFTILGSLATAVYPESCFVRTLLVDIHTMYLHLGSLIVSIYLIGTKEVEIKFKNLLNGYYVFLVFVFIAEILNIIMYNSKIIGDETFNMFYISPYFISDLPLLNNIQTHVPFIVFIIIYLLIIFIGALLVWLISKFITSNKKDF